MLIPRTGSFLRFTEVWDIKQILEHSRFVPWKINKIDRVLFPKFCSFSHPWHLLSRVGSICSGQPLDLEWLDILCLVASTAISGTTPSQSGMQSTPLVLAPSMLAINHNMSLYMQCQEKAGEGAADVQKVQPPQQSCFLTDALIRIENTTNLNWGDVKQYKRTG